jgi:hypothetical protein
LQDYYAILGLDQDASPESVKVAYRRLARQYHPDMQVASGREADKASVDAHMAQLNEAYAVLSNAKRRREYDDQLRLECVLTVKTATRTATKTATETRTDQTATSASPTYHARVRPQHEVDATVITQFSGHLRQSFISKKPGLSWGPVALEGFDWGLEALTWSACYCVALRGFESVDSAIAKKFINYSEMVLTANKRAIRKNHFLFLLPFLQMIEWDSVSRQIQSFLNGKGSATIGLPSTGVILLDMHHGRTLRLGSRFSDKRFEELIQSIRTSA